MDKIQKNKWIVYVTILLLVANIVALSMFWIKNSNGKANNKGGASLFEFISTELAFTPTQRAQYEQLKQLHQKETRPLQDSLRTVKEAFFSLLKQQNLPDTTINQQYEKVSMVEKNISLVHFRHFQQIRAICTSKQQQKFDEILLDVVGRIGGARPPGMQGKFRPPPDNNDGQRPPPPPEGHDRMGPPPVEN